eukprot:TRINITY_DN15440_c0_g1_i2.p1 TRINITY_DN15440_c0_g1~~TRINITY_DN15440_c0_g1_i2.p1  ORF type:complete len:476 (-),score=98.93 TRINITY_DN15440_c0_g1_i2:59-1429(-)
MSKSRQKLLEKLNQKMEELEESDKEEEDENHADQVKIEDETQIFAQQKHGSVLFNLKGNDAFMSMQQHDLFVSMKEANNQLYFGTLNGNLLSWSFSQNRLRPLSTLVDSSQRMALTCFDITSPNHVVSGLDSGIMLLSEMESGQCLKAWTDHEDKISQIQHREGFLYSTGFDGFFQVRNLEYDRVQHHYCACRCPLTSMILVDPSNQDVVIGSMDGIVRRLDLRSHECVQLMRVDNEESPVRCLTAHPDQPMQIYASYGNSHIKGWDLRNPMKIMMQPAHVNHPPVSPAKPPPKAGAKAPAAAAVEVVAPVSQVKVDTTSAETVLDLKAAHADVINCLLIDKNRLFSGSDDRSIHIHDLSSGQFIERLTGFDHPVTSLSLIDGELFSLGMALSVRHYDITNIMASIDSRLARIAEQKRLEAERKKALQAEKEKKKAKSGAKKGATKGKKGAKKTKA